MKHDINNIELDIFHNILLSALNECAPLKQKHIRTNNGGFVTKELRRKIMKRTRLRNNFLKKKYDFSKALYNKQRNICVSLVRKSKREYYENIDVKCVQDNKKVSPFFSNKIKSKEKIALVENAEIVTEDSKLVKIFNDFFSTVVDKLNIAINDDHISETSSSDPVWASIERFSKRPSILNIKKRMGNISPKFKFQYVDQNQISKEIQNLNSKKAMQQNDIPVKLLKENNDSFSYVIYHNFNNPIYEYCFPYNLKTADLTPVYKKEEKFLKQNYKI